MAIGVACVPPVWDAQQVRSVADPYEFDSSVTPTKNRKYVRH